MRKKKNRLLPRQQSVINNKNLLLKLVTLPLPPYLDRNRKIFRTLRKSESLLPEIPVAPFSLPILGKVFFLNTRLT